MMQPVNDTQLSWNVIWHEIVAIALETLRTTINNFGNGVLPKLGQDGKITQFSFSWKIRLKVHVKHNRLQEHLLCAKRKIHLGWTVRKLYVLCVLDKRTSKRVFQVRFVWKLVFKFSKWFRRCDGRSYHSIEFGWIRL